MEEALEINPDYAPAMLGLAKVLSESYDGEAMKWAEKAAKADSKLYQAHELMARMHLEDNNPEKAVAAAKEALAISPNALQALAILAAMDQMDDKPGTEWLDRIFKVNPKYGEARLRSAGLLQTLDSAAAKAQAVLEYSRGRRKKLALAAALIHKPRVLFLDEALNGVDPVSVKTVADLNAVLSSLKAGDVVSLRVYGTAEPLIGGRVVNLPLPE